MSSDSAPPPPQTFQMPHQKEGAENAYAAIGGLQSMPNYPQQIYGAFAPQATNMISGSTGYDPAATTNTGNSVSSLPQEYLPFARDMFAEGFDVNNQVYGRAAHNLQEQVRASQGARGIQTSPYGAGLENEAMGNFNLDWENERLARMQSTMGAALPAYGQAGSQMGYGQQVAQMGPQFQADLAKMLGPMGAQSYQQPQQAVGNWLNYTGAGTAADSVEAQNYASQIESYKAQAAQDAAMWEAIGQVAGAATAAATGGMG